ncbi:MAG: right-handed parallel beta-helix repeat-containing protein [Candidatus Thermoplasmatota archaeon]|nr:right-handed parallel beta-helix repeat-containing protein [Candidatus Thermoplasmatota archaeon]
MTQRTLILIIACSIFSSLISPNASSLRENIPKVSELVVDTNITWENTYIELNENLIIAENGSLTLKNTTLKLNCTEIVHEEVVGVDGKYGIRVMGSLYIFNSTITSTSAASKKGRFWFEVNKGANFSMRSSTLSKCGYNATGLTIGAEDVIIENCSFIENDWGLKFSNTKNCVLANSSIHSNCRGISIYQSTNITINSCDIKYCEGTGIWLESSSSNLIKNTKIAEGNEIGVRIRNSYNNTLLKCDIYSSSSGRTHGILIEYAGHNLIKSCKISEYSGAWDDILRYGIKAFNSYHNTITQNHFINNTAWDNGNNNWSMNYWSDYTATPYNISGGNNKDNDPALTSVFVWEIMGEVRLVDKEEILSKSVIVKADGKFVLENVTLKLNCEFDGEYNIEAQQGSELYINNSTITSNTDYRYSFAVGKGAKLILNNVTLIMCGWSLENPGLVIEADNALLENCKISNNFIGVFLKNTLNNSIIACTISDSIHAGIFIESSPNTTIENCKFYNNAYGAWISNSLNTTISNSQFNSNSEAGLYVALPLAYKIVVANSTFYDNKYDMKLYSSVISNASYCQRIQFLTEYAELESYWELNIKVLWKANGTAVKEAEVSIYDKDNTLAFSGRTDEYGIVRATLKEYTEKRAGRVNSTPYRILVVKGLASTEVRDIKKVNDVVVELEYLAPPEKFELKIPLGVYVLFAIVLICIALILIIERKPKSKSKF